jgi:hypothetical protein
MWREDHLEQVFISDSVIDMVFCDDVKKTVMSDQAGDRLCDNRVQEVCLCDDHAGCDHCIKLEAMIRPHVALDFNVFKKTRDNAFAQRS